MSEPDAFLPGELSCEGCGSSGPYHFHECSVPWRRQAFAEAAAVVEGHAEQFADAPDTYPQRTALLRAARMIRELKP